MTRTFKLSSLSTRLASAGAALFVTATAFAGAAVLTLTDPEAEIVKLERVVVVGQRASVTQLPRVVVVGQRGDDARQVALACVTPAVC